MTTCLPADYDNLNTPPNGVSETLWKDLMITLATYDKELDPIRDTAETIIRIVRESSGDDRK